MYRENPIKLPTGIVEDMPPDEESRLGSDLGTNARVTWAWLKSKYGKPRSGELGYGDRAYDRDYYNGKIGRLYIDVRPYDDRGQWLHNLDQEFTGDGLKDAQKYGFYLLQEHPEVHGFWLTGMLDIYWTKLGRSEARRAMDLGVYQRAARNALIPNHSAVYHVWVLDYRGVPLDSEGPYGPYSLDRAKQFARISATEGDHDRVVSHGGNPDASTFEIVRRYRRGTGERIV